MIAILIAGTPALIAVSARLVISAALQCKTREEGLAGIAAFDPARRYGPEDRRARQPPAMREAVRDETWTHLLQPLGESAVAADTPRACSSGPSRAATVGTPMVASWILSSLRGSDRPSQDYGYRSLNTRSVVELAIYSLGAHHSIDAGLAVMSMMPGLFHHGTEALQV